MGCGPASATLDNRERAALLTATLGAAALAWWAMLALHPGGPGHAGHGGAAVAASTPVALASLMWMAMMVGMMLPPVLPWFWFFASASRDQATGRVNWPRVVVFGLGYFAVWGGFSVVAATGQFGLSSAGLLSTTQGGRLGSNLISGIVLMAAGGYQFSSFKDSCLTHCRSPLTYFIKSWKDGPSGAFSMGFGHGLFCLGCCWALMAVSFAVGVMNLVWMALLTALLCLEKIAPGGPWWARITGAGLLLWGAFSLFMAFSPHAH